MKILHTSDWHLGKKLEGKSRLEEQRQVLTELVAVCEREQVDVVLVAGDIFDTVNPPAEAEELFYSLALKLAAGKRCFVAIAGNHDNADRLSAPKGIAGACNIILAGGMDNSYYSFGHDVSSPRDYIITGGIGYIKIAKGSETLNLALLPYPSSARMSSLGYKSGGEYVQDVKQWLDICAKCFNYDKDSAVKGNTARGNVECNTECGNVEVDTECGNVKGNIQYENNDENKNKSIQYNVLASHLFMQNSVSGDEYELGTASILPASILPQADYVALGHVHKPQKVSGSKNAYYSGSILKYSFDDNTQKYFNLITLSGGTSCIEKIPINGGRNPIKVNALSFDEAIESLKRLNDAWVQIHYDCALPLSAAKMGELRSYENFCNIINVYKVSRQAVATKRNKTDTELFNDYYLKIFKENAPAELVDLFLSAIQGE